MTDDTAAVFNLDGLSDKTARDFLRRAAAETPRHPVWITEGGKRIAAIVTPLCGRIVEHIIGDPVLFSRIGHREHHFGIDGLCECTRNCCTDGDSCLCLECDCDPRDHRERKAEAMAQSREANRAATAKAVQEFYRREARGTSTGPEAGSA